MITLPKIFSDHALFQRDSELTIRGKAAPDSRIALALTQNGILKAKADSSTSPDGAFSIAFTTPDASTVPFELELSCAGEGLLIRDILVGELWLASGQSNMELQNIFIDGCDGFISALKGKQIRCFAQEYGSDFPFEPDDSLAGKWITIDELDAFRYVSAAATAFSARLYDYFASTGETLPTGFLNVSWGGTPIGGWVSREAIESDPAIVEYEKKTGRYPTKENWNTRGDLNYQQLSAMFNHKLAPVVGLKTRGIIWYQGEHDCGPEFQARMYKRYLNIYYKEYAGLFDPRDGKPFPMISSLIYPYNYGGSGETRVGWLNQAFIDASDERPDEFVFAPVNDLPPIWGFSRRNHPIHPTNKYPLGQRMAELAETNAYGKPGQTMPATLKAFEKSGGRLRLTFRNVGSGLKIDGKSARGLYVCGSDGKYLPALCEIEAPDTMYVSHPFIENPENAAYSFTDCEPEVNLWAGGYPLAPFSTDQTNYFHIEARPWLDLRRDSVWEDRSHGALLDTFSHPVWKPCAESEVCRDTVFTRGDVSLRIGGEQDVFGAYVTSSPSNRLDLFNFKALRFDIFNCADDGFRLELSIRRDTGEFSLDLPAKKLRDLSEGDSRWKRFEVELSPIASETTDPGAILRMTLRFDSKGSPWRFVNLEAPVLIP